MTSKEAYQKILPELGRRQFEVYSALKKLEFANNKLLARHLKLPINSITPRINELRKKGLVVYSHTSWCPITKFKTKYWKIETFK